MRVVALLVVACGCRVAASSSVDAQASRGDGLVERVTTDVALWADVVVSEGPAGDAAVDRRSPDGRDSSLTNTDVGDAADATGLAADVECALLGNTPCVGSEGCYPFPFEGMPSGATKCAFQGVSGESVQCQSQVDCDSTTLCSVPGDPAAVCLLRCNLANPSCPTRMRCVPFASYPGIGVCEI